MKSGDVYNYQTEKEKSVQRQREQIVAQSNKLITRTRSWMKLRELRILLYLISKIRPDDKPNTLYELSVSDFAKMCGVKDPNYSRIKEIVENINRTFWIDDFGGEGEHVALVWFGSAQYSEKHGKMRFKFNMEIWPYLFELKAHYTSYPLSYILPMRSQYSVRLYELLKSYKSKNPNHEYFGVALGDLRKVLGAESYKKWDNFKRRILEPALGEMNSEPVKGEVNIYSDIKAVYRVEKTGRTISSVVFHIMKKQPNEVDAVLQQNEDFLNGDIIRPEEALMHMELLEKRVAPGQLTLEDFMDAQDLLLPEDAE